MTLDDLVPGHTWRRGVLALAVIVPLSFAAPASAQDMSAGGPYTGAEGQHVAIQGAGPGASTYRWSAARAPGGQQDRATCQFADPSALSTDVWCNDDGMFDLRLTGSDGSTSTARLTLTNVSPTLTRMRPANGTAVVRHQVVQVSARYRDPGRIDPHKYVIRWGDGSTSRAPTRVRRTGAGVISGSHSYAHGGTRTVTVTVFDVDGGRDRATRSVQVLAGSPCAHLNGAGRLPHRPFSRFWMWARCGSSGPLGAVRLRLPGVGRFESYGVALMRGRRRTATLAGTGRWRPAGEDAWHPRYRYVTSVLDRGAGHDWMRMAVRTPAGVSVLHALGPLAGGNVTVHR